MPRPCVRLLGRPRIEGPGQPRVPPPARKSWAVLARVALADRPVARAALASELFPDAEDPLAALRWSLADTRRSLGLPGSLRGDPLVLRRDEVWLDVWALEGAGGLPAQEVGGVLLDGVEVRGCPGFDGWLLLARARLATRCREELRRAVLDLLSDGDAEAAAGVAHRAVALDPWDEDGQELFLRTLVAAGHAAQASVHLAACTALFASEGVVASPALRAAARGRGPQPRSGVRAAVVADSLLRAGRAALSAGAADAGVETLRRAAEEAGRTGDPALESDVLRTLGSALVHAVRGWDGEGAVVLRRALALARASDRPDIGADVLRELAFVDVQAGRHVSAERALREAARQAGQVGDELLRARIVAVQGMNEADRGRHTSAAALLRASAGGAERAGAPRQQAWSLGVLARSLLLSGQADAARDAAERSVALSREERWYAFLPFPQVLRAQANSETGDWATVREDAESAFALACELRDPCWEGLAARALGLLAARAGDAAAARNWTGDARRRCDRVADRYVWVSAYVGLADLELAVSRGDEGTAARAAARLQRDAERADLPEFLAWALVHRVELGDRAGAGHARAAAEAVDNPVLRARADALR